MDNEPKIARYCVSIEVYDNERKEMVLNQSFNCDKKWLVERELNLSAQIMGDYVD